MSKCQVVINATVKHQADMIDKLESINYFINRALERIRSECMYANDNEFLLNNALEVSDNLKDLIKKGE